MPVGRGNETRAILQGLAALSEHHTQLCLAGKNMMQFAYSVRGAGA
jgi:hypothetical protein